jgi:release factor glutamine methyltransferase
MSQTTQWTVGRLLQWTAEYLGRHGSDSSRLDAEILLAESLGCQRIQLYTSFDVIPDEKALTAFRELVRRRAEGMPVAYLVGRREFYSLSFRVTPDVLIPRPETELLVVALLDLARQRNAAEKTSVCDVGTGCGIIAICAAKHLTNLVVTAIDMSHAALQVAAANATSHGVQERINFVQSDLFANVPPGQSFDFIVSNPPYVTEAEMRELAPEVRDFEPHAALLAGQRGTEVIEPLLAQSGDRLNSGGHLLVEVSPMIHDAVCDLVTSNGRFELGETVKDLARQPRVVQARKK